MLVPTVATLLGIEKFDSNVFHLLIFDEGFFNIVLLILLLGFFVPLPWLVISGKVEAPFRPRLFEVHPTNSQFVPLPIMGFEYINDLPPSITVHLGLRLESWPT